MGGFRQIVVPKLGETRFVGEKKGWSKTFAIPKKVWFTTKL